MIMTSVRKPVQIPLISTVSPFLTDAASPSMVQFTPNIGSLDCRKMIVFPSSFFLISATMPFTATALSKNCVLAF